MPIFQIKNDEDIRTVVASLQNHIWELNNKQRLCPEHQQGSSLQVNWTPDSLDVSIETCCQKFVNSLMERARVAVATRDQFTGRNREGN